MPIGFEAGKRKNLSGGHHIIFVLIVTFQAGNGVLYEKLGETSSETWPNGSVK